MEVTVWLFAALLIADSVLTRTVALPNQEYVAVTMEGVGLPVVMVPGLLGSAYGFRKLLSLLADSGFRAIVIEPLGIGASARPRRADYSLTAQADRIAAVLDTLGVHQAIVMGHALSASIVLRLALRRPELVAGVVALDGGVAETAMTKGFRDAMTLAPLLRLFGGKGLVRRKIHRYMITASADSSWVTADVVEGYTADAARDVGKTLDAFEGMAEAHEPQELVPGLRLIRCPVRLIVGAVPHAGAVPAAEVTLMREHLELFAVDSLPRVGHFAVEEDPAGVLQVVAQLRALHALRVLLAAT